LCVAQKDWEKRREIDSIGAKYRLMAQGLLNLLETPAT
jgi:hypothetical protein